MPGHNLFVVFGAAPVLGLDDVPAKLGKHRFGYLAHRSAEGCVFKHFNHPVPSEPAEVSTFRAGTEVIGKFPGQFSKISPRLKFTVDSQRLFVNSQRICHGRGFGKLHKAVAAAVVLAEFFFACLKVIAGFVFACHNAGLAVGIEKDDLRVHHLGVPFPLGPNAVFHHHGLGADRLQQLAVLV